MENTIIYSSDYVVITNRFDGYYIESFKDGMTIEQFNRIISEHNEIKITNFVSIKNALLNPPQKPQMFGVVKDRISLELSKDLLKAYVTLCLPELENKQEESKKLSNEILDILRKNGVVYGIKIENIMTELVNNKQLLVAEGFTPIEGADSKIRIYELKDAKPEIKEEGNADYYDLKLINMVKHGEWLGERIDASGGISGINVKGVELPSSPGKNLPLLYDRTTVREECKGKVTTLYARREGAVCFIGDKISISNHLQIKNNVDFTTGNIDFDGHITIKGSIEDNFSVAAHEDIEVLGEYGVGSVNEIISRKGSIYIRGGIAGKNKAIIKSKKDIYTKFVSDATIICEGSVHVGFYCLNSNIIAKEVIVESSKGQIIGGNINAEIKVVASIIGSQSEKRTVVCVKGFNRAELKEKFEKLTTDIEIMKINANRTKNEMASFQNGQAVDLKIKERQSQVEELYINLKDSLKELEDERKNISNYLRARGEGEVTILKKAYPGTVVELKNYTKEINSPLLSTTFYIMDREIKTI